MIDDWEHVGDDEELEDDATSARADFKTLSPEERLTLERFVKILEMNTARDPKYEVVIRLLRDGHDTAAPRAGSSSAASFSRSITIPFSGWPASCRPMSSRRSASASMPVRVSRRYTLGGSAKRKIARC